MIEEGEAPEDDGIVSDEPKSARDWLFRLEQSRKAFEEYFDKAKNIDHIYASMKKLADSARDRQFQMFWANIQVLAPSVYSRPPIPVVATRFKDRRPLPRVTAELLERAACTAFERDDIDGTMRLVRDDLIIQARGILWVRYETKQESGGEFERVCIEHIDREDFLHDPARNWRDVDWVARRAFLTEDELEERFGEKAAHDAVFAIQREDKENSASNNVPKAGVWEIWCRSQNKVVWVTEGVDFLLEEAKPHLSLEGFYPCPQPAYGTTQRRSLVPVPDMLFYKDQLEEINELTSRIAALAEAVKVRGLYPGGAKELGDAIETAINIADDRKILVPISSFAQFGGLAPKDLIVWLPIEIVAEVITKLVELRKQLISDVYEITGLSDIMRGATNANETLGAQQLKSQYGSIRIREKQFELVRIARDAVRIATEIMSENFRPDTLQEMAQMRLPSRADVQGQMQELEGQAKQVAEQAQAKAASMQSAPPEAQQEFQQQAEKAMGEFQSRADELQKTVTIEDVTELLRSERTRPFVLDIETDSTIQPDEDAEKQRRTEFATALGGAIQQLFPLVQAAPEAAPFAGEVLKFVTAPFRAGRQLETAIDEFIDAIQAKAGQGPPPNPEAEAAKQQVEMEGQRLQADMAMKQADMQARQQETAQKGQIEMARAQADLEGKRMDFAARQAEWQAKMQAMDAQAARDAEKHQGEMEKLGLELEKLRLQIQGMGVKAAVDVQNAQINADAAERKGDMEARSFEQKTALTQQQAEAKAQQVPA